MDTKKRTTHKMDLLTAVEQVVELSKGSHLDVELFKKAARPLQYISDKLEYGFVPPFMGGKDIKLIVITIRNEERRKNIICTLNLDKQGALRSYIKQICSCMEVTIDNVYATNVFKYFYERPPADTWDVLKKHLSPNLTLLKEELNHFPNVPVITLGEPVLKLLNNDQAKVRYYWRYDSKTGTKNGEFMCVKAEESKLGRAFYPFCHQPSIRKQFYKDNLKDFCQFVINKPGN